MGKVVSAIAVIGVTIAIAAFAPSLTPAFLAHALGTAAATAVVTAGLTMAAGAAFAAFSWAPGDAPSGYRLPTLEREGWTMVRKEPAPPVLEILDPIPPRSLRHAFFFPWQRATVVRLVGDCMAGVVPDDHRWAVVSRYAPIAPGDLFAFYLDDLWTNYSPAVRHRWWWRMFAMGMVKRYLGTEPAWGRLIFDCTNPPTLCDTGFNHVLFAYKVASTHRSRWAAWRASRG